MGYCDQRGEIKNDFVAVHQPIDEGCIADVAADEIEFLTNWFRQIVQPTMAVERIVLSKSRDLAPSGNQRFGQVRTDETARSRHQDFRTSIPRRHGPHPIFQYY